MAYQAPRTWVAGEFPTAAQFNQDVRDNVSFLANPPACRVHKGTGTQSFAHATATTVTFDTEAFDTDNMHNTSVNTERITFNTAGLYIVTFQILMAVASDYNFVSASICKNAVLAGEIADGQVSDFDTSTAPVVHVSTLHKFAVNDYVTVYVTQNNGASAARSNLGLTDRSPVFSAVWVGLG